MRNGRVLWAVSLATMLAFLTPRTALADNVVADDQIVQGNLCVGTPCANGEAFSLDPAIVLKGTFPSMRFTDTSPAHEWLLVADSDQFALAPSAQAFSTRFSIASSTPGLLRLAPDGNIGVGTFFPAQRLHVLWNENANVFGLIQNGFDGPNAAAVLRTQAQGAVQNFQSHASSRTLMRWGVPLGGWNEFLSFVGNGLAMGTFGNAPFILGTSATARMTFDGDSNIIDFGGGGQYNGASFLDASSRTLKQDIRPLGSTAAAETLAGLEPVTFAYRGAPGDGRVGFIAEDVPELVATPGRQTLSALEIVAVLTKVVQEQQKTVQEQRRALQEQQTVVREQQKTLAELTARLSALEIRP